MREENTFGPYSARRTACASRSAARRVDHACSPRQLCARCSLVKIIQYRFKAFERAFGRMPQPNEPLFFATDSTYPRNADRDQLLSQLRRPRTPLASGFPRSWDF
jgi:hypothetical protein